VNSTSAQTGVQRYEQPPSRPPPRARVSSQHRALQQARPRARPAIIKLKKGVFQCRNGQRKSAPRATTGPRPCRRPRPPRRTDEGEVLAAHSIGPQNNRGDSPLFFLRNRRGPGASTGNLFKRNHSNWKKKERNKAEKGLQSSRTKFRKQRKSKQLHDLI